MAEGVINNLEVVEVKEEQAIDVERVVQAVEGQLRGLPPISRVGLRLGLWLLEQGPRLSFYSLRRFSTLDLARSRIAHLHMAEHRLVTFGQLLEAVQVLCFIALGGQPEVDTALRLNRTELIATKRAARGASDRGLRQRRNG